MVRKFTSRFVSKWLILLVDMCIVLASFVLATLTRFNFEFTYVDPLLFKYHLGLVLSFRLIGFLTFDSYTGIVRHTSLEDVKSLFKALLFSSLALFILSYVGQKLEVGVLSIPVSILVIGFFISMFSLTISRFIVKYVYERLIANYKEDRPVIIYGAGHLGRITKNSLNNDKRYKYKIICFLDDNPQLHGKSVEGVSVFNKGINLKAFVLAKLKVNPKLELIFAIQSISTLKRTEIIDELLETNVPLRILPPIKEWMNGELKANQIQQIKIEDLLEREPIKLNNRLVDSYLNNKAILITGAAGSIGSELVRQIVKFKPLRLIILDQAESGLYDIESELTRIGKKNAIQIEGVELEICSVTNRKEIRKVFEKHRPEVVFHAAAYKHVPLMEKNPFKAVEVNVNGTKILADLASEFKVERFVLISTDKAVNPTNVMGASKRLAEMYVQSLNSHFNNNTRFITTRFGNVLGSNGSVIPLFKKQIEMGLPVTVTHPDIIRYFMTISEACQLVLEAGTMGKGGEIFVFDMGEPVHIVDLAKRMIKLSGFELGAEIPIVFTGLRPGEKLFEELLNVEENTKATHHPKILIAKVKPNDFEELNGSISEMILVLDEMSSYEIVTQLKKFIPEYISNNSEFETLDNPSLLLD